MLNRAGKSWFLMTMTGPSTSVAGKTAKMMAAYLRRAKIVPDVVICSTALRAQQTLDPIIKTAKKAPRIVLAREIHDGV